MNEKYGLHPTDATPVEIAINDIDLMSMGMEIRLNEIEWLKPALEEMGRMDLWDELYQLAKKDEE